MLRACFIPHLAPSELECFQWKVVFHRVNNGLHACLVERIVPTKTTLTIGDEGELSILFACHFKQFYRAPGIPL